MTKPDMICFLNDARGIYIPRDFASAFDDRKARVSGVSDDEWEILDAGPEHDSYWDVWCDVCDNAIVTAINGTRYRLHQDGDLFLVPIGMEWDDRRDTFVWPEEEPEYEHEDKLEKEQRRHDP